MKIVLSSNLASADALIVCSSFCDAKAKKLLKNDDLFNNVSHHLNQKSANCDYFIALDKVSSVRELVILSNNKIKKSDPEQIRNLGARIISVAKKRKYKKIAVYAAAFGKNLKYLVEGMWLGNYEFDRYLTKKNTEIEMVTLLTDNEPEMNDELKKMQIICEEVNYVRDIVNEPANVIYPLTLIAESRKMAKFSGMQVKIFNEKKLINLKMGALLAVGKGSKNGPELAIMEYSGGKKSEASILLVGKGITFDSGGLHLKPGNGINNMKYDMAGAATVLGVMKLASRLKLKINLVGIVPVAENMVDSGATKPNDIISTFSGNTVEVTNTDAEGRLVLADALAYGIKQYQPRFVIDVATLTGACITALGNEISGVLGNDQTVVDKILEAGKICGENVWQLPLDKKLREKVKGEYSDLKNYTADVSAGTIMGAAFLSYFTEGTPWAHIDMGGSAWNKCSYGYWKKGASGRTVRLLLELLNKVE